MLCYVMLFKYKIKNYTNKKKMHCTNRSCSHSNCSMMHFDANKRESDRNDVEISLFTIYLLHFDSTCFITTNRLFFT